jgi:hypothetical protein
MLLVCTFAFTKQALRQIYEIKQNPAAPSEFSFFYANLLKKYLEKFLKFKN